MSLIAHKALELIDDADLRRLIEHGQNELKTIDFKVALPGNSDADKKEFLKDSSSFANAVGGDLVFGVREEEGRAVELCGLEFDPDQTKLRLESIIRDGTAPRIPGVQSHVVSLSSGRAALIVRVPQSWAAPHVVTYQNWFRFFSRTSNGVYQLDVFELRNAFLAAEAVPERVRSFRAERLGKIVAGQTPVLMTPGPLVTLHVVPYSALRPGAAVDLNRDLHAKLQVLWGGSDLRINFDGLLNYSDTGYAQLFRNGAIEAVDQRILRPPKQAPITDRERKMIPSVAFERHIIKATRSYLSALAQAGCQPPAVVMLSLLGVEGFYISAEARGFLGATIDRSDLLVPEIVVPDLTADAARSLRPAFAAIWNAAGYYEGSPNYDDEGNWNEE